MIKKVNGFVEFYEEQSKEHVLTRSTISEMFELMIEIAAGADSWERDGTFVWSE